VSNIAWYDQPAKIRYNSFATKQQQTKSVTAGHHTKTTVQPFIIMLHNNDETKWNKQVSCKQNHNTRKHPNQTGAV